MAFLVSRLGSWVILDDLPVAPLLIHSVQPSRVEDIQGHEHGQLPTNSITAGMERLLCAITTWLRKGRAMVARHALTNASNIWLSILDL